MTDYARWHVGMKVVFIIQGPLWRELNNAGYGDEKDPVFNHIYTIRELGVEFDIAVLRLEEIINPVHEYMDSSGNIREEEVWYACHCFRLLEKRETDISAFRELLKPTPVKERV